MKIEYAIIIKNKTRLEALIERFNTKAQAKFYLERLGASFEDYEKEHENFQQTLESVQQQLSTTIKYKIIDRSFLPSFLFSEKHLIITIGQDGLVANTAKYAQNRPILAINPDPDRYDGILLPFTSKNFLTAIKDTINHQSKIKTVHLAEAALNDGQKILAFNELFLGISTHLSARYKITYQDQTEEQSSSGIIVSTKSGSTGWLSSFFNMTNGILKNLNLQTEITVPQLQENQLHFIVREPFKSLRTQTSIVSETISNDQQLIIESLMPENGVIFSDGIEKDFLQFNSGTIATIGISKTTAKLVQKS